MMEKKLKLKGSKKDTTNNQMELLAPIKALKKIPKGSKVQIFTDSKYVKSGITEWINNWKKNGWKTASKQKVKNKDLWVELDILANEFDIKWSWVKAHSTDKLNNEVDLIARGQTYKWGTWQQNAPYSFKKKYKVFGVFDFK